MTGILQIILFYNRQFSARNSLNISQFSNIFCDVRATISSQICMRATRKSASTSSFHCQSPAPNQHQLPASTASQQHQISISFQLPSPVSSTKSASASSFYHQAAAPHQHQLPVFTTRQQQQISISFQFPPLGSSTKSAAAFSFHHQAAVPNKHQLPVSTTRQQHHISQPPTRHPANQLLTLLTCHTHIMAARSVVV